MARLHPEVPRRKYGKLGIANPSREHGMRVPWVLLGAVLVAALVASGVYFAVSQMRSPGRVSADHAYYDFGAVPQAVVEHTFTLTNVGDGTLSLLGVWTSCGCTSAHFVIGGVESPHFGMHDNPSWTRRIAPGVTASLVVLYDATAHPDLFVGERSVFVRTDDPENPEFEFRIRVTEG